MNRIIYSPTAYFHHQTISMILAAFIALLCGPQALADTYYIAPLKSSNQIKSVEAKNFEKRLLAQAGFLLPGPILKSSKTADTVLRPYLLVTELGTKFVLERYDLGELLSVVEIPELDSVPRDSWDRVCSRGLRDVIYGNFQRPSRPLTAALESQFSSHVKAQGSQSNPSKSSVRLASAKTQQLTARNL